MQWLAVAVGGALGAMARFGVNALAFPVFGERLPLGTLIVNVSGAFLIGVFYVLIIERGVLPTEWRNIVMVGFLGAFTTFSTFSLETLALWQNGHFAMSISYSVGSLILCLAATLGAIYLTRLI